MWTLGENSWKLVPGFLQATLPEPSSCADFALHPFAVRSQSCEYDYVLSPVSPPGKPLHLGGSLGDLLTCIHPSQAAGLQPQVYHLLILCIIQDSAGHLSRRVIAFNKRLGINMWSGSKETNRE